MNNFDDLFEQQPQPEATEKPEPQKEKPKKQWWQIREEKQRKEAYATLDRVFGAFSEGHGDMKAYLDTQSRLTVTPRRCFPWQESICASLRFSSSSSLTG